MFTKTRLRINDRRDYLNALVLINNWWDQGRACKTERPNPEVLARLTDGHVTEMAVMS